ncbi:MAG TPA: GspH/FimT family pseudopilin [Vicinamibacteria bacterium]|jgi:hypothetical protein|nr:GspH/FimT family pseudopilin [Vicinamibacteria bacterium]
MHETGYTILELTAVTAVVMLLAALGIPSLRAYSEEAHLLGAGRMFKSDFLYARSLAVTAGVQTAIRFEKTAEGTFYSVYRDGNFNGVLAADIRSGRDRRVLGPQRLDSRAAGVRVGINPGVPAPPPDRGILDPSDPIRFGSSNMLSFSPVGTATPGTFYLAGAFAQAAVRVTGGSARVRLMICRNKGAWVER